MCIEHNAALCLSKEARRWASCATKEMRVIRDCKSELRKLLAQIGDKVSKDKSVIILLSRYLFYVLNDFYSLKEHKEYFLN